jgi:hypothetical protein
MGEKIIHVALNDYESNSLAFCVIWTNVHKEWIKDFTYTRGI